MVPSLCRCAVKRFRPIAVRQPTSEFEFLVGQDTICASERMTPSVVISVAGVGAAEEYSRSHWPATGPCFCGVLVSAGVRSFVAAGRGSTSATPRDGNICHRPGWA
jgi:hypothetical protein